VNPLRSFPAFFTLFSLLSGCQSIFGDFEETPEPPPRVIACNVREYRCDGAALERCKADRSGWELAEQCASPAECNLRSQSCTPCKAGEFQCNGASLERCDAGVWQPHASCASAELCDAVGGTCVLQPCVAGELRCSGAELLRCAPGLDRFERVELCGSPALCTAALSSGIDSLSARCAAPLCADGEHRCDGAVLQRCNTERTEWLTVATCDSPALCNTRAGSCTPCTTGECNHGVYRTCNGSGWTDRETCGSPALCDPDAGCVAPACDQPGTVRCSVSNSVANLELCTDGFEWKLLESCGPEALCDAEDRRCLPRGCIPRQRRCLGDTYQECDLDGVGFITVATCASGSCDPDSGCDSPCSGGFRCNDVHLEECVDGAWQRRDTCASPELCNAGSPPRCYPPLCGSYLGNSSCLDASTRVCAPGRNDWQFSEVCISDALCSAGLPAPAAKPMAGERIGFGPAACKCTPGAVSCNGQARELCNADGFTKTVLEVCSNACVTADDTAACS